MDKVNIKYKLRKILMEQKSKKIAAGVLIKCLNSDKILLLLRNDGADEPNTWSLVSGGIHKDEDVIDGLKREVEEEMSIDPKVIIFKKIGVDHVPEKNLDFHYYEGFTNSEFIPKLDHENLDFGWYDKDELPSPLYPKLSTKIKKI